MVEEWKEVLGHGGEHPIATLNGYFAGKMTNLGHLGTVDTENGC
jgi:hypothetical protein